MIAIIIGAVVAILAALAQWWHGRAVITAEQRGRLDALEQVRRDTEAAERDRAADLARVREDTAAAVDGARGSAPAGPVTAAERDAWAGPPPSIWWHEDPARADRANAAQQHVYGTAPGTAEREQAERALAELLSGPPKGPAS